MSRYLWLWIELATSCDGIGGFSMTLMLFDTFKIIEVSAQASHLPIMECVMYSPDIFITVMTLICN